MQEICETGILKPWGENIWTVDGAPVPFMTVPYPTRMTLVRLAGGSLAVISPIRLAGCDMAAIDALGPVRHLIAPNKIHHLFLAEWRARYPEAKLYAAPGLIKKRRDLDFDAKLGDTPEAAWAEDMDQVVLRGSFFLEEVVFFHRATHTLIVTDCIQRFPPKSLGPFHRLLMWADGLTGEHGGMPREWRVSFTDRKAARAAVRRMIAWDPKTIIIAHGEPVREGGADYLRRAFRWLLR